MEMRLICADEALSDARGDDLFESIDLDPYVSVSAGPSTDYERAAPFHLARAQLDQMVELLRTATGVHNPLVMPEQTMRALRRWAYAPHPPGTAGDRGREDSDQSAHGSAWDGPSGVDPETGLVREGWWDYELDIVRDAITLRQCLARVGGVGCAYAVDGSVTLEIGPEYPEALATLDLRGNPDGEMIDEPRDVYAAAVRATRTVAEILANSPYSR